MNAINAALASNVKSFLNAGNREFLKTLLELPHNSLEGQAVVRYLMQLKHWPNTPDSEFATALDHLFAHREDQASLDPVDYRSTTAAMIANAFDYKCVEIVIEPTEPKSNPGKVTRNPRMVKERDTIGGAADQDYEIQDNVDTSLASNRLQKVIAIQRGKS